MSSDLYKTPITTDTGYTHSETEQYMYDLILSKDIDKLKEVISMLPSSVTRWYDPSFSLFRTFVSTEDSLYVEKYFTEIQPLLNNITDHHFPEDDVEILFEHNMPNIVELFYKDYKICAHEKRYYIRKFPNYSNIIKNFHKIECNSFYCDSNHCDYLYL